jgi:hypothetical protein
VAPWAKFSYKKENGDRVRWAQRRPEREDRLHPRPTRSRRCPLPGVYCPGVADHGLTRVRRWSSQRRLMVEWFIVWRRRAKNVLNSNKKLSLPEVSRASHAGTVVHAHVGQGDQLWKALRPQPCRSARCCRQKQIRDLYGPVQTSLRNHEGPLSQLDCGGHPHASASTSCSLDRLASANPAMRETKSCCELRMGNTSWFL